VGFPAENIQIREVQLPVCKKSFQNRQQAKAKKEAGMTLDRTEDRSIKTCRARPGSPGVVPAPLTSDDHFFPLAIPKI